MKRPIDVWILAFGILVAGCLVAPEPSFAQETDTVKKELFLETDRLLGQARTDGVPLLSPNAYSKAMELYGRAAEDYRRGAKMKSIRESLAESNKLLTGAIQAARVSRVALEEILEVRRQAKALDGETAAPEAFASAEELFQRVVESAEKGDLRAARSEFDEVKIRYRRASVRALKDGVLENAMTTLKNSRSKLKNAEYQASRGKLQDIGKRLDDAEDNPFLIAEFAKDIRGRVAAAIDELYPDFYRHLPDDLLMGGFTLHVVSYDAKGEYSFDRNVVSKLSGIAEFSFGCGGWSLLNPGVFVAEKNLVQFRVVETVTAPETEISIAEVRRLDPGVRPGQILQLPLTPLRGKTEDPARLVAAKVEWIRAAVASKGDIRVRFENVTIEPTALAATGRAVDGTAAYPTKPSKPEPPATFVTEGFTVCLDTMTLNSAGATAEARVRLPSSVYSGNDCGPAEIPLGTVAVTADCQLFKEMPDSAFGPFAVGNTGLIVSGTGVCVDLSAVQTPSGSGLPADWKGVVLKQGETRSEPSGSVVSNTGYLSAPYRFNDAKVVQSGLEAGFTMTGAYGFQAVNPAGTQVNANGGTLSVVESRIVSGSLGPGSILLPTRAVQKGGGAGGTATVQFATLSVQEDLDLAGSVQAAASSRIAWGELTASVNEILVWEGDVRNGYFYLPGRPMPSYSPDTGGGFDAPSFGGTEAEALTALETGGLSGVTFRDIREIDMSTPDHPEGTADPIVIKNNIRGWLRAGEAGIDGRFDVFELNQKERLGDSLRTGYAGRQSFDAALSCPLEYGKPGVGMSVSYASSAVYDSRINGMFNLPLPCGLDSIAFTGMKASSTADLLGGDITLPSDGVTLDYWKLRLVPTGDTTKAGVLHVRTGRVVFTAAGIADSVHFAEPFGLTWGELFADGNIGELFIDYNDAGQRFDDIAFAPENLRLSEYQAGRTDGYLAVCGTVHINYFGPCYVNIHDARCDSKTGAPNRGRLVTVPKSADPSCGATDLHLHADWDNLNGDSLAVLDFPDATVSYHDADQYGFIGTGKVDIDFIHSDGLDATVEIHGDTIDVCMTSSTTHDVDFGMFSTLCGMSEIRGCIRITGPLLERIHVGGYMEASSTSGSGILEPKTGFYAETLFSVTPNSCTFSTSGDMLLSVAASAVDVSGTVYLKVDWSKQSAEGEIQGKIDCNTVVAGLDGEGQITWYVDPDMQYFQGKVKIAVCTWTGGAGLEGGLFIGHNVPKAKAWVLYAGGEHFGLSEAILPDVLTGLYGYGQLSMNIQYYVFGGGIQVYAGMGAFTETPSGISNAFVSSVAGFPYFLGSVGVYVHGEILGGLVSVGAWGDLDLRGPVPLYFEGTFGLEGCVLWVLCASVDVTAGISPDDGFYIH
jgi:hypothetical protein